MSRNNPILYIVIPCYNEEQVLPHTNPMFVGKIEELVKSQEVHPLSKVMYVNDGSKDKTWELIQEYASSNPFVVGISQSRNRGHQSSVLAGMYEAAEFADIVITIDADGQDDIDCMNQMIAEYKTGSEIVYGVRDNRDTDSAFKRITAEGFYKVMHLFGAEVVFNHADYRLVSKRFIHELAKFKLESAIDNTLLSSNAINIKAVKALLDMGRIKLDGEVLIGINEQIEALKTAEDSKMLFKTAESKPKEPNFSGVKPGEGNTGTEGANQTKSLGDAIMARLMVNKNE